MGAKHSHHQNEMRSHPTSFDVEKGEEVTAKHQSETLTRGKVVEMLEVEADHMRETLLQVLETKCEALKYENRYLRGQVNNLKEKVEMLENANKGEEFELKVVCLEMNDFEKRIQTLESQLKVKHSPAPQTSKQDSSTTENLLEVSEDFIDYEDEVLLSDNTKDVITVSESCSGPFYGDLDPVFVGMDKTKEGMVTVESVVIINQEGSILLDQLVPSNECEEDLVTEKVLDHVKDQLKLKEVLKDKLLVGYDLSNTLKVLNLDHPEHLSMDIRDIFSESVPCVKPSLKLIVNKFLKRSEYEHSRINEALVTMEIFKKVGLKRQKKYAAKYFECRILMPKFVMEALREKGRKILKEAKRPEVLFSVPFVGGVLSIFADDISSLSKALHDLLQLVDYPQHAPQLKMIVPCGLPVKKNDFVAKNVTMYGRRLPMSKEKVVGFGQGVLEMVSGVEQCLLLMEKNQEFCSYGGPGSRYDYSDRDGQTAALCGDWDDANADVPQGDVECSSCQVVGLQHFSGAQLRRGEARRCRSCVCS